MNFGLSYNYTFWPEMTDTLLASLADFSIKEGNK